MTTNLCGAGTGRKAFRKPLPETYSDIFGSLTPTPPTPDFELGLDMRVGEVGDNAVYVVAPIRGKILKFTESELRTPNTTPVPVTISLPDPTSHPTDVVVVKPNVGGAVRKVVATLLNTDQTIAFNASTDQQIGAATSIDTDRPDLFPVAIAARGAGDFLFTANFVNGTVTRLDSDSLANIETIPIGGSVSRVAIQARPDGGGLIGLAVSEIANADESAFDSAAHQTSLAGEAHSLETTILAGHVSPAAVEAQATAFTRNVRRWITDPALLDEVVFAVTSAANLYERQ